MKRLAVILSIFTLAGCGKNEAHWSHKECVKAIVESLDMTDYVYSVKELDHDYVHGDDEVYCFDITVKGNFEYRYYCFAVVDDGEVLYVDCDAWGD